MEKVFVIITELNGYKNTHSIFANKAQAEEAAENIRNIWAYCEHDVFVCEFPVW